MIEVTRSCPEQRIDELQVRQWPIWSCKASTFPWEYDQREVCWLLEGDVTVTPETENLCALVLEIWWSSVLACVAPGRFIRRCASTTALVEA